MEQHSCLYHLLNAGVTPAADFSSFGPLDARPVRRMKVRGLRLQASGELPTVETYGPPHIHVCKKCFGVLTAALVARYAPRIFTINLARRYGLCCVLQAGVRCRARHRLFYATGEVVRLEATRDLSDGGQNLLHRARCQQMTPGQAAAEHTKNCTL